MNRRDLNRLMFDSGDWQTTKVMGIPTLKYPAVLVAYMRLFDENPPDVVVELGTLHGGSALYFARMGVPVITVDNEDQVHSYAREHPLVDFLVGDSTSQTMLTKIKSRTKDKSVFVILDSDHSAAHVAKEIEMYSPLVTEGQHMVVEDTGLGFWGITGHPYDGTPWDALQQADLADFVPNLEIEPYVTMNPLGWLRRA